MDLLESIVVVLFLAVVVIGLAVGLYLSYDINSHLYQ
jgi:hypothetical protein